MISSVMSPAAVLAIVAGNHGDFDLPLIMAICQHESSFDARAWKGEPEEHGGPSYGLMQLQLPTARDRGYRGDGPGLFDPVVNVQLGVAQLAWIKAQLCKASKFGLQEMVAAYNEGLGNALRGNQDPLYTQSVLNLRALWQLKLGTGVA